MCCFCKDTGGCFLFSRMISEDDHCESGRLFGDPYDLKRFRHLNMDNENRLEGPEQGHCDKMSQFRILSTLNVTQSYVSITYIFTALEFVVIYDIDNYLTCFCRYSRWMYWNLRCFDVFFFGVLGEQC